MLGRLSDLRGYGLGTRACFRERPAIGPGFMSMVHLLLYQNFAICVCIYTCQGRNILLRHERKCAS